MSKKCMLICADEPFLSAWLQQFSGAYPEQLGRGSILTVFSSWNGSVFAMNVRVLAG